MRIAAGMTIAAVAAAGACGPSRAADTSIAIHEHVDGKVVDWMEHVSDAEYSGVGTARGER